MKIFKDMRTMFGRAHRLGVQMRVRQFTYALAGLGIMILAPAAPAQKLPAPNLANQSARVAQPVPASPALAVQTQEPPPQEAPAPHAPEQAANKPPQVSYEAGQLTIIAENSRLSEVMSALRACMGADVDIPASASGERVWARLGPGPARKILATLLSGTKLDYVIQASESDPDGIRNVWLTARTNAPSVTSARAGTSTAHPLPPRLSDTERSMSQPNHSAPPDRAPEESISQEPAVAAVPTVATAATVATDVTPAGSQSPPSDPVAAPTGSQPAPAEVASVSDTQGSDASKPAGSATDQMIHTLQNMYEQRKQMQLARTPSSN